MKNEQVYSYIERRMIDTSSSEVKFDPNRHKKNKSFTVGDLLKRILIYSVIFIIIIAFIYYPNIQKNKETTHTFINDISLITSESSNCINILLKEYSNNNFTITHKETLRELKKLED